LLAPRLPVIGRLDLRGISSRTQMSFGPPTGGTRHAREQGANEKRRELARGLVPVVAGADGLMASLQRLAGEVEDFFSVSCRFVCDVPVLLDDVVAGTHLFHIAQEAVSNAVKHGRATRIVVALSGLGDWGRLAIQDNGVGIASIPTPTSGMGLHIMKYRASMIGGSLEITREPNGTGTIVECSFPIRVHV
jgi:two-component system, LuxR family, sensor kinase FixL